MSPATVLVPKAGVLLGGRYQLEYKIARAGTSEVWLCKDMCGRSFAAKLLKPDPEVLQVTVFEQSALQMLGHVPGVVHLVECFTELDRKVLILDLLGGVSLMHRIATEGPLNYGEAIKFSLDVTRTLKEMHGLGLGHGDIKSANIQLWPTVLMDLGLTRRLGDATPPPAAASGQPPECDVPTLFYGAVGTPGYLAPDIWEGEPFETTDDFYALGCVLTEALTGKPPFMANTAIKTGVLHRRRAPKPLASTFPQRLRELHMWLLAKSRKDRPQTADELICALSAI